MHIELDTLDSSKQYDGEIVIPLSKVKGKIVSNISGLTEVLKGTRAESFGPIVIFTLSDWLNRAVGKDVLLRLKIGDSSPIIRLKGE